MTCRSLVLFALAVLGLSTAPVRASLGLQANLLLGQPEAGSFPLVQQGRPASLYLDAGDYAGVLRAARDVQADIERVTGRKPGLVATGEPRGDALVIAGTLGKSALIDRLVRERKIDLGRITGQRESFVITTVAEPLPGVRQALVIAGSDKRGTIYGLYELSEQIGVSPWYWWADVPAAHRDELLIKGGTYVQGPPVVEYRGIFINDEEPAFGPWAREKFGGVNSKMYAHMFELMLRLRANYLWPAMWGKSLYEEDPESARLADEYGIIMGSSHHEPMMRYHKDWTKRHTQLGNGEWNYATNAEALKKFFREGAERNKTYETLTTIGMRGDGDEPMTGSHDMKANVALLEKIVADQRDILADVHKSDPAKIPQVWALYKEVADYYANGMRVPDDVALLWCDDNWGNIRRLPTAQERTRAGGAGVYYHFDYVGGPRSYKWINTNPLPKIWEQMNLAAEYGATRIWIVNVGDLKPMELPVEFFLRMAWDPRSITQDTVADWTRRWAAREFGETHAAEIADLVSRYAKYNAWRKPELLAPDTFSFVNYTEAERVLAAWDDLVARADKVAAALPAEYRDAYFELVQYPVKASATVARLYLAAGRNHLYAKQGRASALDQAARARELFRQDQQLSDAYHAVAGGKWNHMMAQTRIGYTGWADPKTNILPALNEPELPATASLGVAIEGSESAWPGSVQPAVLPGFDSVGRQHRWIDVFRRGTAAVSFTATASEPWVKLSATSGDLAKDQRLWVDIDWTRVPAGAQTAHVTVARPGGESVSVRVDALRSDQYADTAEKPFFGDLTGPVGIEAARASASIPAGGARWEVIPDYGRGPSAVSVFPVTAPGARPGENSPRLEYRVLIPRAGQIQVDLITGVALNIQPDRGVRLAVSFDDEEPQILDLFEGQATARLSDGSAPAVRDWGTWVKDNAVTLKSTHTIAAPGVHTLKVWMVDPGIVLQKLVVHTGKVHPSYFGPVNE